MNDYLTQIEIRINTAISAKLQKNYRFESAIGDTVRVFLELLEKKSN